MSCIRKNSRLLSCILFVLGAVLLAAGCVVKWKVFPQLLNDQVAKNLKLEKGSEMWDNFISPPVPIHMNFHFLNVENGGNVSKFGDKPVLKEVGPYVYREIREKQNVTFGGANTIYYNDYRAYIYDQEATDAAGCTYNGTKCSSQDLVTVLNPIAALIDYFFELLPTLPEKAKFLAIFLNNFAKKVSDSQIDGLVWTKPVDDILYNGAKTTILDEIWKLLGSPLVLKELHKFKPKLFPKNVTKEQVYDMVGKKFPQLAGGTFGIFKGRNNTVANSFYRVDSGANNLADFLSITEFNGECSLPKNWWAEVGRRPSQTKANVTGICHDIKGTDGSLFAPGVDKTKDLWIFVSELCRSIWLRYDSDQEVDGIAALRYRAGLDVFDMDNKDNYCYCPNFLECAKETANDTYDNSQCKKQGCMDGLISVGKCMGGAPVFMSSPHFFNADPSLVDAFSGLKPDRELHDTILDVEPITGLALNARKRIQVNFPLKKQTTKAKFVLAKNLNQSYQAWPVFWADENARIDTASSNKFKSEVVTPMSVVSGVSIGLGIVLGGILIVLSWAIILFVRPHQE